ncbi:DUF3343 domain-containing protein [Aerococcus sanguinicola]|uniref:DUF3343 domain-containing protein n=1 Tax=unclassified Aerococcus TaxID=2618060 RepID=UPI0008A301C7|nr:MULTISPECIES: DUF3343 domain-containing protein [unclassified Aerococcus]MDK6232739.1 DUF3343 domain-containing protein [Aerococcus sp. UMB10185]MDK6805312.1 DUF3343 domain-containing protein [Aerococcus sp. UMB7834]MDK6854971.1 DUF3343 domain-containing protein [Aerococcus sp. UMB7533]MDK8501763.1 DUF3343 domain-containing protein [Aerococcus sp. UMB1112A]OFN02729.1 hypothetical protein HMPREF2626_02115 [Aerococcus sp. HMSC062A02]
MTIFLLTFKGAQAAMQGEKEFKEAGFSARLVPTPESISAACGLALRIKNTNFEDINQFFSQERRKGTGLYLIEGEGRSKQYTALDWN